MDLMAIREEAICNCSPSGDVITVTMSADEYDYLTTTAGVKNTFKGFGDDLIEIDYPKYRELIAKVQEQETFNQ